MDFRDYCYLKIQKFYYIIVYDLLEFYRTENQNKTNPIFYHFLGFDWHEKFLDSIVSQENEILEGLLDQMLKNL